MCVCVCVTLRTCVLHLAETCLRHRRPHQTHIFAMLSSIYGWARDTRVFHRDVVWRREGGVVVHRIVLKRTQDFSTYTNVRAPRHTPPTQRAYCMVYLLKIWRHDVIVSRSGGSADYDVDVHAHATCLFAKLVNYLTNKDQQMRFEFVNFLSSALSIPKETRKMCQHSPKYPVFSIIDSRFICHVRFYNSTWSRLHTSQAIWIGLIVKRIPVRSTGDYHSLTPSAALKRTLMQIQTRTELCIQRIYMTGCVRNICSSTYRGLPVQCARMGQTASRSGVRQRSVLEMVFHAPTAGQLFSIGWE